MQKWAVAGVLPNVEIETPIEAGLAALVRSDDPRVRRLRNTYPIVPKFLARFKDAFGKRVLPSVLLIAEDAPSSIYFREAVAGFRDAIAISVVPYNRALGIRKRGGFRIYFSNAFWLYPWTIDKSYTCLVGSTPAAHGMADVDAFRGQSSPEVTHAKLAALDVDEVLLAELLRRWRRRYERENPELSDIALFRSLNMANQASLIPGGADSIFYDEGRSIALWVSAFEILAHPETGYSGLSQVCDLLEKVNWELLSSCEPQYKIKIKGNHGKVEYATFGCWLYNKLYKSRCDFLHGTPVDRARLALNNSKWSLFHYAAPLYRLALTAFLPLSWNEPVPVAEDASVTGRYLSEKINFLNAQRVVEEAINTARVANDSL